MLDIVTKIYHRLHDRVNTVTDDHGQSYPIYRCENDGRLVVHTQAALHSHNGHLMRSPVTLDWMEWLVLSRSKKIRQIEELAKV